jgi:3-methyladenine DNA glycosylase AlkD
MPPKNSSLNADDLVKSIRCFCKDNANPAIVKKYSRFFKDGYDAYGLESGSYDACLKKYSEKNELTLKLVLKSAPNLIASGKYEETFFVIIMLKRFYPDFTFRTFKEIEKWFKVGIVNWAHADVLAGDIIARFLQDGIVPMSALEPWLTAQNKFQRRIVPVSLIKLLNDTKDIGKLIAFIQPLMSDEAREVHQGVGWFLREAWKLDKPKTEKFLLKWKNTAPRLIFQYDTEKMTPAEKARFKKEK